MNGHMRWWVSTAALALCMTATFAGTARAERPDDRPGLLGVGLAESSFQSGAMRPDDRAGLLGVGSVEPSLAAVIRPDDHGGARGPGRCPVQIVASPSADVTASTGMTPSWASRRRVALLMFGAALALTLRSRRRVILP